jgi:hypothetical protein
MEKANPLLAAKLFKRKREPSMGYTPDEWVNRRGNDVLMKAFNAWTAMSEFRRKAERRKRFVYGDQWSDPVKTACGWKTERETILCEGMEPITNNLIYGVLRTITGYFLSNQTEPVAVAREREDQNAGEMMTATLQYVYQNNNLWQLDADNVQYAAISGLCVMKHWWGKKKGVYDVYNYIVSPNRMFFNHGIEDTRGEDVTLIGEIHDMSMMDILAKFGNGNRAKIERLKNIYGNVDARSVEAYWQTFVDGLDRYGDFFYDKANEGVCRVFEVWTKEAKERYEVHDTLNGELFTAELWQKSAIDEENRRRVQEQSAMGVVPEDFRLLEYRQIVDTFMHCYFLSPYGDILEDYENPYWNEEHPYSFGFAEMYDGEIFSFLEPLIGLQKMVNRFFMIQYMIYRKQAKGVTYYDPKIFEGTGWTAEMFNANIAKIDASIPVNTNKGQIPYPRTEYAQGTTADITNMIGMGLRMFDEISNMNGILQGRSPSSGTPASLYMQQTQNASISMNKFFEAYRSYRERRDLKNLQFVQQYYDEPRYINVTSKRKNNIRYNPQQVRNLNFIVNLAESQLTPVYRMMQQEVLLQLMQLAPNKITPEIILRNGNILNADQILEDIKSNEEAMAEQQQAAMAQQQAAVLAGESNL